MSFGLRCVGGATFSHAPISKLSFFLLGFDPHDTSPPPPLPSYFQDAHHESSLPPTRLRRRHNLLPLQPPRLPCCSQAPVPTSILLHYSLLLFASSFLLKYPSLALLITSIYIYMSITSYIHVYYLYIMPLRWLIKRGIWLGYIYVPKLTKVT